MIARLVAPLGEAAEDEGVDAKPSADLRRLHLLSLEGEGGRSRDDTKPAEARELVDEALRYSVAQILDRGVASCILERQDRDQTNRGEDAPTRRALRRGRRRKCPQGLPISCGRDVIIRRQQARYSLDEIGRNVSRRQVCPLHLPEFVRNESIGVAGIVDDERQQKRSLGGHQMGAIDCKLPFKTEIPFGTSARIRRDDRHEQGAGLDLLPDRGIPCVATAQLALVEPDLNAGLSQRLANAAGSTGVLRRIAEEDRLGRFVHLQRVVVQSRAGKNGRTGDDTGRRGRARPKGICNMKQNRVESAA